MFKYVNAIAASRLQVLLHPNFLTNHEKSMLKNPRRSVVPEEDNPVAKSPNPVVAKSGLY